MARGHNALTQKRDPMMDGGATARLGSMAPREAGPAMGDGGGAFSAHYMGGRGNDAYRQEEYGHRGMAPGYGQRIGFKHNNTGGRFEDGDGSGAELDAYSMLRHFADTRFGKNAGDLPVEEVMRAAWEENQGDPNWERAIHTVALSMGATPPWEVVPDGHDDRVDDRGTDMHYGDTRRGRY